MSKPNYIVGDLKIAQITEDSLLYDVEKVLKGREAFKDVETNNEKIYQADVFEAILCEDSEAPTVLRLSDKVVTQLEMLNDQTVEYNYIQII